MATNSTPPDPDLPNTRKPLRTRPLWRLFGWGSAACIALAAVALTSQTEAGSKRLQLALFYGSEPVHVVAVIPPRAPGATAEAETMRLAAQLRELATDREQLKARIAMLERNLEDMTGSIKLQSEQLAAARAAAVTTPQLELRAPATTPALFAPATPPASALPAITAPAMPLGSVLPPLAPQAMPALIVTAASWPATHPEAEKPTVQANGAGSENDPARLPPVRVATAPANEPVAEPPEPAKDEFGIDLGGANSLEVLRIHWATLKANYGPLLVGLHPVATQHPKRPTGVTYRLVAGPLPDAAEAARLCARFPVLRTGCHPAKFIGAQLAAH
jgi:hypothetical protein